MPDLIVLEILGGLFLLIPALRRFGKNWRPLNGIYCLPPLSLFILVGIIPAYGFRPEGLPLLVYAVVCNIRNLPVLSEMVSHVHNQVRTAQPRFSHFLSLAILAAVTVTAVYFVPLAETELLAEGVESREIDRGGGKVLFLRTYGSGFLPAVLVAPPAAGSVPAVDRFCGALRDGGFRVITWSRQGSGFPVVDAAGKRRLSPPGKGVALLRALLQGRTFAGANSAGRELEAARREDAEFLLERTPGVVLAVGFGAGGAALLSLGGEPGAQARFPSLAGIVLIESPPYHALRQEQTPPSAELEGANWFRSVLAGFTGLALSLKPRRVIGLEAIPELEIPALFISSDRVRNPAWRDGRYSALIRYFRQAKSPAIFVSVDGAGYLDYTDYPEKYPVLCVPFRGMERPLWAPAERGRNTALLARNFAAALLAPPFREGGTTGEFEGDAGETTHGFGEGGAQNPGPVPRPARGGEEFGAWGEASPFSLLPLPPRGIQAEVNGLWNSRGLPAIIGQ